MSYECEVYGYIAEPKIWRLGERKLVGDEWALENLKVAAHNDSVLGALPKFDYWPPVSRLMFHAPPKFASPPHGWDGGAYDIGYFERMVHFAFSGKSMDDDDCRDWIKKYEELLGRMIWSSATVHFDLSYMGYHAFRWDARSDAASQGTPVKSWKLVEIGGSQSTADDLSSGRGLWGAYGQK
jgi:hypothetical protein